MLISVDDKDTNIILHIEGRIDARTATDFENKTLSEINQRQDKRLILDFSAVEYISSAGLRSLILLAKKMNEHHKMITLCNMNETVYELIHITGLVRFFNIFPDVKTALAK